MNKVKLFACIGLCLWLAGCASTKVEISGTPADQPLCQSKGEQMSVLVLWGPEWRPDQKEPQGREAAAREGIDRFFSRAGCFSKVAIRRLPIESLSAGYSDSKLLHLAENEAPALDRVVFIKVKELGPFLRIGLPVPVEGGTEVVLEVKVFNVRTTACIAAFRVLWRNGGPLVIKGVKTLEQDLGAALGAALAPGAAPR